MFTHIKHKIERPLVKAQHNDEGHYYETPNGIIYPSITTVFKLLDDKEWYPHWVASIARKEGITEAQAEDRCKEISYESLDVGNMLHKYAEIHLNNQTMEEIITDSPFAIDLDILFEPLHTHLNEHVDNIHATEAELYSDEMQIAGTVDCVAEYDGVLSVIDFKNSRKPKTKSECKKKNYFEQICAYGKMWEFCTGQKIEQGVILVISWDGKVKPFKVNLKEHELDLWKILVKYEHHKALNTT